ncbi:MAG TPA: hypothetical protein VIU40_00590 [Geobacteraceae bacterium]
MPGRDRRILAGIDRWYWWLALYLLLLLFVLGRRLKFPEFW